VIGSQKIICSESGNKYHFQTVQNKDPCHNINCAFLNFPISLSLTLYHPCSTLHHVHYTKGALASTKHLLHFSLFCSLLLTVPPHSSSSPISCQTSSPPPLTSSISSSHVPLPAFLSLCIGEYIDGAKKTVTTFLKM
jgi:hypothetical protein